LPVGLNLQESRWDFLHAAKLGHGTYYFTSPPKEGILRIFWMPGFESANSGSSGQYANH
jgi:hypothetical protein